jgi:hypothetical protein
MSAYDAPMVQSWGVSRFNGQLSMLEASLQRAGASLAWAFVSKGKVRTVVIGARHEALFDAGYLAQMRVLLCATAVSALAVLILVLL